MNSHGKQDLFIYSRETRFSTSHTCTKQHRQTNRHIYRQFAIYKTCSVKAAQLIPRSSPHWPHHIQRRVRCAIVLYCQVVVCNILFTSYDFPLICRFPEHGGHVQQDQRAADHEECKLCCFDPVYSDQSSSKPFHNVYPYTSTRCRQ